MLHWPNLVEVLAGLPWAVAGAVATRRYMPERATRDLDIVILAGDRDRAGERLRAEGYERLGSLSIGCSSWTGPDGTPVDVVEGRDAWWPEALAEAGRNLNTQGIPALTAPYLILMKLQAGRVQDVADVTRILGSMFDNELDEVRSVLRANANDLLEDLERLIVLGKLQNT